MRAVPAQEEQALFEVEWARVVGEESVPPQLGQLPELPNLVAQLS